MFRRTLALLGASMVLLTSACLLDDKQVGGEELEQDPPDPCEVYCERVDACLDEDEALCLQSCPDQVLDDACRDAVLSVLSCLAMTSCDEPAPSAQACADALQSRTDDCGG